MPVCNLTAIWKLLGAGKVAKRLLAEKRSTVFNFLMRLIFSAFFQLKDGVQVERCTLRVRHLVVTFLWSTFTASLF